MNHTPGPWTVYQLDWRSVVDVYGNVIADVRTRDDDARLIAAAPDLLAALEQIALNFGISHPRGSRSGGVFPEESIAIARAAIAKATGGDDLDTTTDSEAWRRAGHTCERETLDGASTCPHPSHANATGTESNVA